MNNKIADKKLELNHEIRWGERAEMSCYSKTWTGNKKKRMHEK